MNRLLRLSLLVAFAATIVSTMTLFLMDGELKTPTSPEGIRSLALASNSEEASQILDSWAEQEIIIPGINDPKPGEPIDEEELFSRIDIAKRSALWRLAVAITIPLTVGLACWVCIVGYGGARWLRITGYVVAIAQPVALCLGIAFNMGLRAAVDQGDAEQLLSPIFYNAEWWIANAGLIFIVIAFTAHRVQVHRSDPGERPWRNLFSILFYQRIPLFFMGLFLLLAWLGATGSLTLQNSMITDHFLQTVTLSAQIVVTSAICFYFLWSVRAVAHARLSIKVVSRKDGGLGLVQRATIVFFLALPMLVVAIYRNEIVAPERLSQIGVGVLASLIGVLVSMFLLFWLRFQFAGLIVRALSGGKIAQILGKMFGKVAGADQETQNEVNRVHSTSFATVVMILLFYIIGYFMFHPENESAAVRNLFPAMAYVLGVIVVLVAILSGMTLILDQFRFPILLAIGLLSWINFQTKDAEHYFIIDHEAKDSSGAPMLAPADFRNSTLARLEQSGGQVTLVCCEGGGIQAAAWTAQVLQGLSMVDPDEPDEPDFAPQFAKSIHLISSTSGGSVGALHYLESFDTETGIPDPDKLSRVSAAAADASLQEALWGLIYPDLWRVFLPVRVQDPEIDRAWAIERAWIRSVETVRGDSAGEGKISDWMHHAETGKMPGVCFNATSLTEGRQLAISTLNFPDSYPQISGGSPNFPSAIAGRTFASLYNSADGHSSVTPDMAKVTAARLSASFPVITPSARARHADDHGVEPPSFYVADGGYFDNLGTVATVEWIRSAMADPEIREKIKSITILMIVAFPGDQTTENGILPEIKNGLAPTESDPWSNAFLGPLAGMMNVRDSLQQAHGYLEISEIQQIHDLVKVVVVQPNGFPSGYDPPLSWQLSNRDKAYLRYSWSVERTEAIRQLRVAAGQQ